MLPSERFLRLLYCPQRVAICPANDWQICRTSNLKSLADCIKASPFPAGIQSVFIPPLTVCTGKKSGFRALYQPLLMKLPSIAGPPSLGKGRNLPPAGCAVHCARPAAPTRAALLSLHLQRGTVGWVHPDPNSGLRYFAFPFSQRPFAHTQLLSCFCALTPSHLGRRCWPLAACWTGANDGRAQPAGLRPLMLQHLALCFRY